MALQFGMYDKISIVLPTDFPQPITVADSFQNYCMTSHLQFEMFEKISFVLPTDFYLSIIVTDSFQNYLHTQPCSLECLKRLALFYLQIFTCPSEWRLPKLLHDFTALQFGMYKKINIVLPTDLYLSILVKDSFQN